MLWNGHGPREIGGHHSSTAPPCTQALPQWIFRRLRSNATRYVLVKNKPPVTPRVCGEDQSNYIASAEASVEARRATDALSEQHVRN